MGLLRREWARALRSFARTPLLLVLILATLALGIGGSVALFSVVNAAYLRQLPYPRADRIVAVWQTRGHSQRVHVSMLDALDWGRMNRSFSHLGTFYGDQANIRSSGAPQRVPVAGADRDFFAAMGTELRLGRLFSDDELRGTGAPVVVLGDALWRSAFGADPHVVGKSLAVGGVPLQVIGVLAPGFAFPEGAKLWLPVGRQDGTTRTAHNYQVVARLRDGVSLSAARADMARVAGNLARAYPDDEKGIGVSVVTLRSDLVGRSGLILLLLMAAVLFVLLIACVNVANLLLARALSRDAEATLRSALGASRRELYLPFLAEGLLLAVLGSLLGLALAGAARGTLARLAPPHLGASFPLDGTVLTATLLLTLLVALFVSLAPAFRASRLDLRAALSAGAQSVLGRGSRRGMSALIAAEVAITFLLLVGAGLLVRSALRLDRVEPGFRTANVALATADLGGLPGSPYSSPDSRVRYFGQLLEQAAHLPGVRTAGLMVFPPLEGFHPDGALELRDVPATPGNPGIDTDYHVAGGDLFAALGIRLIAGRTFAASDRAGTPQVAVVNESLARILAGSGKVLGRQVRMPGMDGAQEWATVVGVVGDLHLESLARPTDPEVYFPLEQRAQRIGSTTLVAATAAPPGRIGKPLAAAARRLDPGIPLQLQTMDELVAADKAPARFRVLLLTFFAVTALLLASIGLYGVIAYGVGQRTSEVGLRLALGADRGGIERLIIKDGMLPVLLGVGLGLAAALALTRLLASLLFGVQAQDPATLLAAGLLLLLTALVAAYVPAQRATTVEPVVALRAG
jgi:putative ABC transport system permease protein